MERSDEILSRAMVHTGLAADAGVDLSQQRGRDLNDRDPPHVYRCDEACDVPNDTAAQGNDRRLPRQFQIHHSIQQPRHGRESFGALAVWDNGNGEVLLSLPADGLQYSRLGNHEERSSQTFLLQTFFEIRKYTNSHQDLVLGICDMHSDRFHKTKKRAKGYDEKPDGACFSSSA